MEQTIITLPVTIARETRDLEFRTFGDGTRAWSGQVAVCRRNGGKLWPCHLTAYLKNGKWSVSMNEVRLNRQYPITGWREDANRGLESQHNSR